MFCCLGGRAGWITGYRGWERLCGIMWDPCIDGRQGVLERQLPCLSWPKVSSTGEL